MGVKTLGDTQVVFVDAPGIVGAEHYRNATHKRKVESAFGVASECDVLLFVVDAARHLERKDPRVLGIIDKTRNALSELLHEEYITREDGKSVIPEAILVLNKVDLIEKHRREELVRMVKQFQGKSFEFSRVFPISAMSGAGTKALMDHLLERAPVRSWDFDATKSSDMTDVQRALEIVREAVYNRVHEDIPYGIDIVHVSWEDFRNGDVRIEQNILVDTTSQRKIVVGKSGDAIGQIGINARVVLEAALGRKVHLILNVRMKKRRRNWGPVASRAEEY
jgi:GTP-binding protein Era